MLTRHTNLKNLVIVIFIFFTTYLVHAGWKNTDEWIRKYSCSGHLEIKYDNSEKAMRFIASFSDKIKDRWIYPLIKLTTKDQKTNVLRFDIKAIQTPSGRGYKNVLVIFYNKKGKRISQYKFRKPNEKFSTVVIKFAEKSNIKLIDVAKIRIGLNNKDATEVVFWIRNLTFSE